MNGLGGLNKSPDGVVVGVVQLQLPNVVSKDDLSRQTEEDLRHGSEGQGGHADARSRGVSGITRSTAFPWT